MTKFNHDLIDKARKGEIAILNDGSMEDLNAVMEAVKPQCQKYHGAFKYYIMGTTGYWGVYEKGLHFPGNVTKAYSVKDFFMPDTKEHSHRAFKLKQRLPDLPAGSIFVSIKQGDFYQCQGTRYKAADVELDSEFFEEIGVCKECGKPINPPK